MPAAIDWYVHLKVRLSKTGDVMQQNVPQPVKPPTQVPAKTPVRLTPEQLTKVSGAGLQQSALPGGRW